MITVNVKKIVEGDDTYYLATSEDIQGFLVEGNTMDEVIDITPSVIIGLLKSKNERMKYKKAMDKVYEKFNKSDSIDYRYQDKESFLHKETCLA